MSAFRTQTSFTAGEIDPLLAGRLESRAAAEGCHSLRNLVVQVGGGVTRRPGTQIVRELQGADRLIGVELPQGSAVVAVSQGRLQVLESESLYSSQTAPWTTAQIARLRWAHRGTSLLFCHPDVEPQELSRDAAAVWTLRPLAFTELANPGGYPLTRKPFSRFAAADVSMQPTFGAQPITDPIPADRLVTVRTSKIVFTAAHLYTRLRIRGRQLTIINVTSATQVVARTDQPLIDGQATYDWQEEAFSNAHGWPVAFALHQDRLVVGGTRDLPDRVWLSRTSSHFDFDPGTGLDDEGISFALTAEGRQEIVAVLPSRQLQLLTTAGEWVVSGTPLTPTNITVELQTSIGSRSSSFIPPAIIDGATLFIGSTGRELREFSFTDAEQAYQAADLAVLCRHLLTDPVDMTFDARRRLLCIVRGDGRLATVTLDRTSNIAAWSLQETAGAMRAVAVAGGKLYLATSFNGRTLLERFEPAFQLDHCLQRSSPTPTAVWTGLDLLVGQPVVFMTGTRIVADQVLTSPTVTLAEPATSLVCGVRFSHQIEALPLPFTGASGATLDAVYRITQATFRVDRTAEIAVDIGNGLRLLRSAADPSGTPVTADLSLRALGWRRTLDGPPWRIQQSTPAPFTLLATTLELKVNT